MSEVRTCYKCQVERPLKMFYVGIENRRAEREGRSQWQMHCRSCQQTINTARRKPRQDHADAVKLAAGCADCGIKSVHPEIYDFDHRRHGQRHGRCGAGIHQRAVEAAARTPRRPRRSRGRHERHPIDRPGGQVSTTKWRKGLMLICKDCDSIISEPEVLRAGNPFNPEYALLGCPNCKAVDQFRLACAASGCTSEVSMGMPHEDGVYRSTCSKHRPEFLR